MNRNRAVREYFTTGKYKTFRDRLQDARVVAQSYAKLNMSGITGPSPYMKLVRKVARANKGIVYVASVDERMDTAMIAESNIAVLMGAVQVPLGNLTPAKEPNWGSTDIPKGEEGAADSKKKDARGRSSVEWEMDFVYPVFSIDVSEVEDEDEADIVDGIAREFQIKRNRNQEVFMHDNGSLDWEPVYPIPQHKLKELIEEAEYMSWDTVYLSDYGANVSFVNKRGDGIAIEELEDYFSAPLPGPKRPSFDSKKREKRVKDFMNPRNLRGKTIRINKDLWITSGGQRIKIVPGEYQIIPAGRNIELLQGGRTYLTVKAMDFSEFLETWKFSSAPGGGVAYSLDSKEKKDSAVKNPRDRKEALAINMDVDTEGEDWTDDFTEGYADYVLEYDGMEFLVVTDDEADDMFREQQEQLWDDMGLDLYTETFREWILKSALNKDRLEKEIRYDYEEILREDIEEDLSAFTSYMDDKFEKAMIEALRIEATFFEEDTPRWVSQKLRIDRDDYKRPTKFNEDVEKALKKMDVDELAQLMSDELLVSKIDVELEALVEKILEEWDVMEYLSDIYTGKDLADFLSPYIDLPKVFEQIEKQDGRGSTLAGYDGDENEEKVNGELYFIYRTN